MLLGCPSWPRLWMVFFCFSKSSIKISFGWQQTAWIWCMHPIKHTSLSGYRCVYTSANQRNNVTFVFQRKGELTNKRGGFPLKKRSLCKWPLYDCNRRVESNFFPKRRFLAVFHCMNNLGHSIKKSKRFISRLDRWEEPWTRRISCSIEGLLRCLHCGRITSCPAQPCKEVTARGEKSFPQWPNQTSAAQSSWLYQGQLT